MNEVERPGVDAIIRRAEPGDASGLARVHTLGWQQGYADLLPADFLARRVVSSQSWLGWLSRPLQRSEVFVAEVGGEVVGFTLVGPAREDPAPNEFEVAELKAIYLLAEFWGRGIGYRLHQAGLAAMARLGYRRAELTVLAGNRRTREFYRRQGWVDDEAETELDIGGVTARVRRLRHDLTSSVSDPDQSSSVR